MSGEWETVIGLEVHVQLATNSKLFCGCANSFGAPPNTNVCPVCLGLPGALPVPNAGAIRLATRAALVLGAKVRDHSVFARKHYFYPDLPKGYQISQFDAPLATGGTVGIQSATRGATAIGITRLHVEEDAGKLLHDRFADRTAIDLNRAGVPLVEIVSEPDVRSPAEARAYLTALRQIMVYAGVSECSMEQGSLRVDANLSLRRTGAVELGTKTEVKNLNSFANVERALDLERVRQEEVLGAGSRVEQVTLHFDADAGTVRPIRSKEESHDYRYFPDPDLEPLVLSPDWVAAERDALPELPAAKRQRFQDQYELPAYDAKVLSADQTVADYFEAAVAAGAAPKPASNWVMGDVLAAHKSANRFEVDPSRLAELLDLIATGTLSHAAAKLVFVEMRQDPRSPRDLAEALGVTQVRDTASLEGWVSAVLNRHPEEIARYRAGEGKLKTFFVGQVMKASKGKADPRAAGEAIERALA